MMNDVLKTRTSLYDLVKKLTGAYQPIAVSRQSFFINEISDQLPVNSNFEVISQVINSLIYCVSRCSDSACIRVCAGSADGIIELDIKTNNNSSCYDPIKKMEHIRLLSKKIGGMLAIYGYGKGRTNIVFSFNNIEKEKAASVNDLRAV